MAKLTAKEVEALYGIETVLVYKNGLEIIRKARYPMPRPMPPTFHGSVIMSRKSKMRLANVVQNTEIKFNSMLTLTYGDYINPIDGKELKRQTNILLGHIRKRFLGSQYVWFLEFTKKLKPHLHVITTIQPTDFDRVWLGQVWAKVSVYDAVRRLLDNKGNGLRVVHPVNMFDVLEECSKVYKVHKHPKSWEAIRKADGAARYMLKYATKAEQKLVPIHFQNVGRFWGVSSLVKASPIAQLNINETMSEEGFKAIFSDTALAQLELLPKYIFQKDALQYFSQRGLRLTEIFDENNAQMKKQNPEIMVQ